MRPPRLRQPCQPVLTRAKGAAFKPVPGTFKTHQEEFVMLKDYRTHVAERAALGIPPLPLSAAQT
ncbi:MAG: hypothetical protein Q4A28_10540, partial [Brachymonas sp.]|nr:hypothetical protein [Brachymonas sp.]